MSSAVLGVEKSVTDRSWVARDVSPDLTAAIARAGGVSEIIARVLAGRNVRPEDVEFFLTPRLAAHLPEPYILKDMEKAALRIADAVMKNEKIAVFGDYDVDGATSASVLTQFLKSVSDAEIAVRIPERDEGYGPTAQAVKAFEADGASLIITVDCGTTAFDALEGVVDTADIIVADHHEPEIRLPKVYAVVNPKRLDEPVDNPCRNMAAVGVVFLLIVAVNRILRQKTDTVRHVPNPT